MSKVNQARSREYGLTLVELIVVVAIVGILASAAYPVARFAVRRAKERELRADLDQMRTAIDKYKDAADRGGIQVKPESGGYPPDLHTLVDGVDVLDKRVRFLRSIPLDPMTGTADWGLRSMEDDPGTGAGGGDNVFDVYSKSTKVGSNGKPYSEW